MPYNETTKGSLMLEKFIKKESVLEEQIDRCRNDMDQCNAGTQEYDRLLAVMERLIRLQREERSNRVSPDTLAVVGANLLGILIIVGYEHGHVIGSRAFNLILRTKHQ